MRAWTWVVLALVGCGARLEIGHGAPAPAPTEVEIDASGIDAATDAARPDAALADAAVVDAALSDGGVDAFLPVDAGRDAGTDAGSDAGHDAAVVVSTIGCGDGQREAFGDVTRYPRIAGCAGGWTRPGIAHPAPTSCGGQGGDDGPFPSGGACGVSDFCAVGWHVCTGPADVGASSPDGCAGAHDAPEAFFATRMSSSGCGRCATGTATDCTAVDCRGDCAQTSATTNDVFGCGTLGAMPDPSTCGVLDAFSNDLCGSLLAPWSCTDDGSGTHEAELLVKPGPGHGGVLCCRD